MGYCPRFKPGSARTGGTTGWPFGWPGREGPGRAGSAKGAAGTQKQRYLTWKRGVNGSSSGLFTPQNLKGRDYLKDGSSCGRCLVLRTAGACRLSAIFLGVELALEDLRKTWYGIVAEPLPGDLRQALAVGEGNSCLYWRKGAPTPMSATISPKFWRPLLHRSRRLTG